MPPHGSSSNGGGSAAAPERVLILGAAGRDYHTFNALYRGDGAPRAGQAVVVGFTHAQIPHIEAARYPAALAGAGRYPGGLPIWPEARLEEVIKAERVTRCVMAYSDVSYAAVMRLAARARAAGAVFELLPPDAGMLKLSKPVVAVTATRTGCGKSQVCALVIQAARAVGLRIVLVRHPMPYGDLASQAVQRFATADDLDLHRTTIEEREEYQQHIINGVVVYAGVDYAAIFDAAQREADVVLWDGGNNDAPFARPDLWLCVADPLRPTAHADHYPGDANFLRADIIVANKSNTAPKDGVAAVLAAAKALNPAARAYATASVVRVDGGGGGGGSGGGGNGELAGRKVVVVEDGPTITHGGMATGAGYVAAMQAGAVVVDPRPYFAGEMAATLAAYPHIGPVVPAMGYSPSQLRDLAATLRAATPEGAAILVASPTDLERALPPGSLAGRRVVQVTYGLDAREDAGGAALLADLAAFFAKL